MQEKSIAVLGGGSWATAIVKILLENTKTLFWWVREEEIKEQIEREGHNPLYLSSVELPKERLYISNDIKEIISKADILILVIPSAFLDEALQPFSGDDLKTKLICSAVKGIIPQQQQVVGEYLVSQKQFNLTNFAIISGPSHAEEIALERLTYLTAASQNQELAKEIANLFSCRYVQTRISDDIFGIEYAAVSKNIYALAVGIAKGLGYGDNFRSVLVANALAEMQNFLAEVHDIHRNVSSAVYLGDLLVTSYSQHSRNRAFGVMIGEGYSVRSAIWEMKMVAEGYYAAASIKGLKHNMEISMPIVEAVHAILYENASARKVFRELEAKLV